MADTATFRYAGWRESLLEAVGPEEAGEFKADQHVETVAALAYTDGFRQGHAEGAGEAGLAALEKITHLEAVYEAAKEVQSRGFSSEALFAAIAEVERDG